MTYWTGADTRGGEDVRKVYEAKRVWSRLKQRMKRYKIQLRSTDVSPHFLARDPLLLSPDTLPQQTELIHQEWSPSKLYSSQLY
jgi:hypothetical protein